MLRLTAKVCLALGAAAAIVGIAACAPGGAGQGREPARHVVHIDATRFEPRELTVAAGDTVVWVNDDVYAHTSTTRDGAFDSADIPAGGSWSYVASAKGLFPYECSYHPTMTGALRVR